MDGTWRGRGVQRNALIAPFWTEQGQPLNGAQLIDTGIGIPASAQHELFNPFTQVARPGGRMQEGTGLGLAISRNLARALGGDITLASEVGRGSRFAFWLPLVGHEPDAASASATFRRTDTSVALGKV